MIISKNKSEPAEMSSKPYTGKLQQFASSIIQYQERRADSVIRVDNKFVIVEGTTLLRQNLRKMHE